ncbi:putative NBD/HSP70 family sugar kinase [Actinocorallia herbida]|uniref:Putative NBD/HSP70 family sugar kinase n=1 Tax=Actinocorallia herbida TaxID=58109 RepID=A0A3N1CT21_9ACTN|nr:ROK family transcriptional regulator [Actinocorallia herbida]ROO84324.1 putative NBD/HSP70 family sugar kinase [Actinocorallia herbida]
MSETEPGVLARVRLGHEERVVALLRERGALSRAELGALSGLSRSTLSDIAGALVARGAVVVTTPESAGRKRPPGRPAELLTLNPDTGQAIGLDFGHRRVHVAVANAAQEVIGTAALGYARTTSWQRRLEIACGLVDSLRTGLGPLHGIGVGVTGPLGRTAEQTRRVTALTDALGERFGVPVAVDNNTRLAALAEMVRGAGKGFSDVVYARLSEGVGGGIVVSGRLLRGAGGGAGEIGHIPVDPAGAPCSCGGRGCLETVASVPAVVSAAGAADLPGALEALEAGEASAVAAFDRAGRALGFALASVCNTVSPARIVVGGEVAVPRVLAAAEAALAVHLPPAQRLPAHPAALGDEVGALGALALVAHDSPLLIGYPGGTGRGEDES